MADEFRVTSTAFGNDGRIPRKHTADGAGAQHDMSPPLQWHNVPEETESLAIICEDVSESPDSTVPFVHWVVVNIPPTLKGLPQGFHHKDVEGQKEYGDIQEGVNDFKVPGYRGPSPPTGEQRIEFRVYALDSKMNLGKKATKEKLVEAMEGHILAETMLVGHYAGNEKDDKGGFTSARGPMDGQSLYNNLQ
ncbi:hypothetical protein MPTK1_7g10210 [Marchantia polymorpha subsp. ruderalis]|uniref:YbhB/YbcL family Raf kinase inhibitor-like protein n=2 Tax=Marchantia polymorpha TaxID=3197 RepID=A0A176WJS0_MARPO|nr:hypothetical protein AXG93_2852s1160 [Marchantia polymorpha subsp. ruderalis]PTQ49137.1 hypothetical protein MARPO_0003s0041 [Marchantia polymorpha]BBN16896.1 hypothetical protein Mp_7g10210 [Marchantia polymorpha subsp. ruderalis]|eukprot:PTQ49137.1 hypothetical protein MARPO_0003s0041 [Marchantia polymorpha]